MEPKLGFTHTSGKCTVRREKGGGTAREIAKIFSMGPSADVGRASPSCGGLETSSDPEFSTPRRVLVGSTSARSSAAVVIDSECCCFIIAEKRCFPAAKHGSGASCMMRGKRVRCTHDALSVRFASLLGMRTCMRVPARECCIGLLSCRADSRSMGCYHCRTDEQHVKTQDPSAHHSMKIMSFL